MNFAKFEDAPGKLICLEGIDGCGKDTQADLLVESLRRRGYTASLVRFPDYDGPLGTVLQSVLADPTWDAFSLQLMLSAERLRQRSRLIHLLKDGQWVICSRYSWSAVVYSVARGLPRSWAESLEVAMPAPNLTILLEITVAEAQQRLGRLDTIEADTRVLENCRREYGVLAGTQGWGIVDALQSAEQLHLEIDAIALTRCQIP